MSSQIKSPGANVNPGVVIGLIKRCFGDHSSAVRDHRANGSSIRRDSGTPSQNPDFNTVLTQLNESPKTELMLSGKGLQQLSIAFCIFINLIVVIPAFTDLPPLIPRQVLFGNEERISARISPDGTMLAYLAPDQGVMNVWVRTMGKNDDRVITADRKRGIRSLVWQWDSRHLLYGQDVDGDENWHFYQTNLETKTTRDLTPFKGIQTRLVAFDPKFPDQMLVALNIRDPQLHDVYRLNLKTGAVELDTQNPGDVGGWTADNNHQVRVAAVTTPDGGTELRIRDDAKSPWRTFQKWSANETFGEIAAFGPDNQHCWVITSVGVNAARLLEVDLKSGTSKVIAEDPQYDVEDILLHPTRHELEAVAFVRSRTEWKVIDPAVQADFDLIAKAQRGDFWVVSRDLADKNWIVGYWMDDGPLYYYHYDRAAKKATKIFSDRPALETYKLSRTEPISFKARDGMTIHGYLTLPVGVEPRNLPMVLNVHGGPWWRDTWGYNNEVQWLANRGYAVLQINFRGSNGYGKQYLNAGDREWAGKMHTDLIDGKNFVAKQGIADPQRVCIMGASYGGYATLVGLAFTPDEFACGIDLVGPSNLVTFIKTIPPYWAPSLKRIFEKRMGKETEEEFLKSRSPLFKVDQIKAPLLIAHGANDPRIKQAESDQMVQAIRNNGKIVEYLVFPDEGHGFARPENNLIYYAAVEQFLAKYLRGRAEPVSEKENAEAFRR
jgi:dipeptidyl aminopeptidase/acylaminoacyl peptidase